MSQRSFVFTENCLAIVLSERSHTVSEKVEHTEMAFLYFMDVREGNCSKKNFIFTRRKTDEEELLLMIAHVTYS